MHPTLPTFTFQVLPTHTAILGAILESPDIHTSVNLPEEYRRFEDVFGKIAATKQPQNRPRDCAIDLLPGTKLPKGRIYPLSIPDRKAMDEYIKEVFQQEFIHTSTTPVASSFFFVAKKDGGTPSLLHPCAFFSKKLSPAEQNYDIGNRELLAIKLALEEWRHWLEGVDHPFEVITDRKNLQYLREVKRLNPRQA